MDNKFAVKPFYRNSKYDGSYMEIINDLHDAIVSCLDEINNAFASYRRYMYECSNGKEKFDAVYNEDCIGKMTDIMDDAMKKLNTMSSYTRLIKSVSMRIDALTLIMSATNSVRIIQQVGNDAITDH